MTQNLYLNKDFPDVDGQSQIDFFALYANEQFRGYYISQESEDSELYDNIDYSGNLTVSTNVLIADYNNQVQYFKDKYEQQIRGYNISQKNSNATYLPVLDNTGPYGGSIYSEPTSGYGLINTYSLKASDWESENLPVSYQWFYADGDNIENDFEYSPITTLSPQNYEYNTTFLTLPVTVKLLVTDSLNNTTQRYIIINEPEPLPEPEPQPQPDQENLPPWLTENDYLDSPATFGLQFQDGSLQIRKKPGSVSCWLYGLYNVILTDKTSNIGSILTNYSNAYIDNLSTRGDLYYNPFGARQTQADDATILDNLIEITDSWTNISSGSGNNSFIDDFNLREHDKDPIKLVYLTEANLLTQKLAYTSWYSDSDQDQFIPIQTEYNLWVDAPENMQIEISLYLYGLNYSQIIGTQMEIDIINLVNSLYASYFNVTDIQTSATYGSIVLNSVIRDVTGTIAIGFTSDTSHLNEIVATNLINLKNAYESIDNYSLSELEEENIQFKNVVSYRMPQPEPEPEPFIVTRFTYSINIPGTSPETLPEVAISQIKDVTKQAVNSYLDSFGNYASYFEIDIAVIDGSIIVTATVIDILFEITETNGQTYILSYVSNAFSQASSLEQVFAEHLDLETDSIGYEFNIDKWEPNLKEVVFKDAYGNDVKETVTVYYNEDGTVNTNTLVVTTDTSGVILTTTSSIELLTVNDDNTKTIVTVTTNADGSIETSTVRKSVNNDIISSTSVIVTTFIDSSGNSVVETETTNFDGTSSNVKVTTFTDTSGNVTGTETVTTPSHGISSTILVTIETDVSGNVTTTTNTENADGSSSTKTSTTSTYVDNSGNVINETVTTETVVIPPNEPVTTETVVTETVDSSGEVTTETVVTDASGNTTVREESPEIWYNNCNYRDSNYK